MFNSRNKSGISAHHACIILYLSYLNINPTTDNSRIFATWQWPNLQWLHRLPRFQVIVSHALKQIREVPIQTQT
jgi:hypothetical protein